MEAYLVQFVTILSTVLYIALLIRVFSSWFNVGPTSPLFPILNIVYQVTEPILAPIRRVLPRLGMLDLSPMVALLLLPFIRSACVRISTGSQANIALDEQRPRDFINEIPSQNFVAFGVWMQFVGQHVRIFSAK